jgi:hypothetical protein
MLLLIVIVAHAVTAALEAWLASRFGDPLGARELAGRLATLGLALLGAAPVWLGPAAEIAARLDLATIDAVVGMSPLTHLAIASGNDLFRNPWFYQHTNFAALQYSYPTLESCFALYGVAAAALLAIPIAAEHWKRASAKVLPAR